MTNRTLPAAVAVLVAVLPACGPTEEPLLGPGQCDRTWARVLPLGDGFVSSEGGTATDHGATTLVAWEASVLDYGFASVDVERQVVMMALFDNHTGELLVEPTEIHSASHIFFVRVASTSAGYLVLAFEERRAVVIRVSEDGVVEERMVLDDLVFEALDDAVVADDDGVTIFRRGPTVLRLDAMGREQSRVVLSELPATTGCWSATARGDGRLVAWCRDDTDAPFLVILDKDGANPTVVQADGLPRVPASLSRIGEGTSARILAVLPEGDAMMAVVFDDDANVVTEPRELARVSEGYGLLGSPWCKTSCKGVEAAALGSAGIGAYESLPNIGSGLPLLVSFLRLELVDDEVRAAPFFEVPGQLFHLTPSADTLVATWIEEPGFTLWPWDNMNQNLIVKHDCAR